MHSSLLMRLSVSWACVAGIASASSDTASASSYTIADTYTASNFFSQFQFFNGTDPTNGFVKYVSASTANNKGLAGYISNGFSKAVYLGVDHTTVNPPGGRASVRVTSKKSYTHGLFIADITHMPGSICGVWPAFWTFGPNWPASGEIDIMEGVNAQTTDAITLHTSAGCTMNSTGALSSSSLANGNCNAGNAGTGCSTATENIQGYGNGFNSIGGGVYAMEWTSSAIKVFFFPRSSIPSDITSGSPKPTTWSTPVASFSGSGCNIDSHFMNHNIVFDTTFCGQWAGQVWSSSSCASKASTCDAYVSSNPSAFAGAYWSIKSVKVYQTSSTRRGLMEMPYMA